MLKYTYIFQIKYTEAILSNITRKLLWFEFSKMLTAVKNKFTVLFIIIIDTAYSVAFSYAGPEYACAAYKRNK